MPVMKARIMRLPTEVVEAGGDVPRAQRHSAPQRARGMPRGPLNPPRESVPVDALVGSPL